MVHLTIYHFRRVDDTKGDEHDLLHDYGLLSVDPKEPQVWIAWQFMLHFPTWTIIPGMLYDSGYDFSLHHSKKKLTLRIAVETKPLNEPKMRPIFTGVWEVDRKIRNISHRVSQLLSADYVFWTTSAAFGDLEKQYLDHYQSLIGVTRRGDITKDMLLVGKTPRNEVILYPMGINFFSYLGTDALTQVFNEIEQLS